MSYQDLYIFVFHQLDLFRFKGFSFLLKLILICASKKSLLGVLVHLTPP